MLQQRWLLLTLLALLFACQGKSHGSERLPTLGVMADSITVAGISSGGYMAGQFHLAHSNAMSGLGIIAAGPYYCAENSIHTALGPCVKGEIAVPSLLAAARAAAEKGAIDSLDSVRDDRVWLFHGTEDKTVAANVVAAARDFYTALTDASNITYVDNVLVTHGLPTLAVGADCTQLARPYLNACGYDLAGQMLQSLRGELKPPAEARGRLIEFDQSEFGDASLNASGYLYVSSACGAGEPCRLLVFFHGCDQSAEVVGDAVVRGAGFNEWAETNGLVVLYPQSKSSRVAPMNPLGCWDWWGYTGEAYATRDGAQIKAVKAMIERLSLTPLAVTKQSQIDPLPVGVREIVFREECASDPGSLEGVHSSSVAVPARATPNGFPATVTPRESRIAGEEGMALVEVLVNEAGRVDRVRIARSSGFERLDQAALEQTRPWRFIPAKIDGRAACWWGQMAIVFKKP